MSPRDPASAATGSMSSPRPLPAPRNAQVWLDFDGTVTLRDCLDELIEKFSRNDSWRIVEERWRAGIIGSRECLEQEFALLDVSAMELRAELAAARVDAGAAALLAFLGARGVPVAILSDGVDTFIRAILVRAGIKPPTIRANAVTHRGRRLRLRCPNHSEACESRAAHCKCASARALAKPGRQGIYVGDGQSDLCPARKAHTVFAKGALAAALTREGRPFTPYSTLADIRATLAEVWPDPSPAVLESTR